MSAFVWFAVGVGAGGVVVAITITNLVSWWRQCDVRKIATKLLEESKEVMEEERLSIPRGAELSEQELAGLLNVPDDHPVLRGVLEVMARAEDQSIEDYCAPGKDAQFRAEGGVAVRAIRSLRADVLSAVEMARGPKKTKN